LVVSAFEVYGEESLPPSDAEFAANRALLRLLELEEPRGCCLSLTRGRDHRKSSRPIDNER
jgi:hypothetical protein